MHTADLFSPVGIPFWFIAPMIATLFYLFTRRQKRHKPGYCRTCGYDLRATRDRCPECGTIPTYLGQAAKSMTAFNPGHQLRLADAVPLGISKILAHPLF